MTSSPRPDSVTLILRGGLGNQIFQFAAAWALVGQDRAEAIRVFSYGSEWGESHPDLGSLISIPIEYPARLHRSRFPGVAVRESWRDAISIQVARLVGAATKTIHVKQVDPFEGKDLPPARHIVLDGFFQHRDWWSESWSWVADLINRSAPVCLNDLRAQRRTAMKVRRSDYMGRGIVLSDDYYRRAVRALAIYDQEVTLVSEDERCLPHFERMLAETGCVIRSPDSLTGNPNFDDFWNLAAASTQVLANSSYCWWAAATANVGMLDTQAAYPVPWLPNEWSQGPLPDMGLAGWISLPTEFQ